MVKAAFSAPLDFDREAVPGTQCSDALANVTSGGGTDGHSVAKFYNSHRRVSVVSLGCGTNDYNAGVAAATTIANIQAWVTAVQAAAPLSKIWVMTVPDRGNMSVAGGYTWKSTVNTAIRALAGGNVSVMDLASTHLDCDGCAANPTYFNSDQIHFSGTNGVPPDANNNGIVEQSGVAISVMTAQGIQ